MIPCLLMQDLTTINVTPDYIVVRQTKADLLAWPAAAARASGRSGHEYGRAEQGTKTVLADRNEASAGAVTIGSGPFRRLRRLTQQAA